MEGDFLLGWQNQSKNTIINEFKHQSYKIPDIEISSDMMENIMVVGGVVLVLVLVLFLLSRFLSKWFLSLKVTSP